MNASKDSIKSKTYQKLHTAALTSNTTGSEIFHMNKEQLDRLSPVGDADLNSITVYPKSLSGKAADNGGTVYIDEWKAGHNPNNVKNNKAMIYVVPPDRSNFPSDASFLDAVENTAEGIVLALEKHNSNVNDDDQIKVLRICAFSTGTYSNLVDEGLVINNINQGLAKGFKKRETETVDTIEVPHSGWINTISAIF